MKRALSIFVAAILCVTMVACGGQKRTNTSSMSQSNNTPNTAGLGLYGIWGLGKNAQDGYLILSENSELFAIGQSGMGLQEDLGRGTFSISGDTITVTLSDGSTESAHFTLDDELHLTADGETLDFWKVQDGVGHGTLKLVGSWGLLDGDEFDIHYLMPYGVRLDLLDNWDFIWFEDDGEVSVGRYLVSPDAHLTLIYNGDAWYGEAAEAFKCEMIGENLLLLLGEDEYLVLVRK